MMRPLPSVTVKAKQSWIMRKQVRPVEDEKPTAQGLTTKGFHNPWQWLVLLSTQLALWPLFQQTLLHVSYRSGNLKHQRPEVACMVPEEGVWQHIKR